MVVCGAESTEIDYLSGFRAHFKRRNLSVRVTKKPGSPLQLVQYAADRWGGADREFDQIWCVTDVDEYGDLTTAMNLATESGIELAVSNPCFEVWLLLHHSDQHGWLKDYRAVRTLLRKHVEVRTDKSLDFERDYGNARWRLAARRARLLAPEHGEHMANPSTRMWKLALVISGEDDDRDG
ncbi:RloB family protein [Streptomyces otsuchiensis]|uniref:RloB family protein n=1 Tax=Streptomyces otsuchiensis TaxID=2681388 RepID=UPI0013003821|nr:RloB family protein [Streptomyces otsuchiensis]